MSSLTFGGSEIASLGVSYELSVAPQTGASLLRVPIPAAPGRDGLGPSFSLAYSSQGGNSPFGAGWSLSGLPVIGINTRKNVPRWDGRDGYQLGSDEIVPWLEKVGGQWQTRGFDTEAFRVTFYRLRLGGSGVRIERWQEKATGRIHFRTRDAGNVLTLYGARTHSQFSTSPYPVARISAPEDETRTYLWLPEFQIDPHGSATWLEYAPETLEGVERVFPFERRSAALAQRYLKRVLYGNSQPLQLTRGVLEGQLPTGIRWCFQLVLDYGDHSSVDRPAAAPDRAWPARRDAFSTFRPGFEIPTNRLCRRLLTFHDFPELGDGPTLISALTLVHDEHPAGATIREIGLRGYRRDGSSRDVPSLTLTYSPVATETGFRATPVETQANVPAGLASQRYQFVDLYGEGLPGILAETERATYYKPNFGGGEFGAQTAVLERPAVRPGTYAYGDHDRDGDPDLAQMAGRLAGAFEFDRQKGHWSGFQPISRMAHVEALGGRTQWVDLNGDGKPDIVVAKSDRVIWFPSEKEGFGDPVEISRPMGRRSAPLLSEELALDFFFADMNGDGLADLVRVQNGRVEYWPNMGNGCFGDGILLDGMPVFAPDDEFDASRVRFIDLDGSGTADLVYLGRGQVVCWLNAQGSQLLPGPRLRGLPYLDRVSSVQILDFLGDGRPCLVWSSPLPGRESPLQYLPLAPALPPRLLLAVNNGKGQEVRLTYASSATHYLRDKKGGRPWASKLPSHVTVVNRHEVSDQIAGTRAVTRYEYRDGHYDGDEREFRGFGQVDIYDADAVEGTSPGPGAVAFAAPSLTRTWFHLGPARWNPLPALEHYHGDEGLQKIARHVIEYDTADGVPEGEEADDALRCLAGSVVRREVFAVGPQGTRAAHPFEVYQAGYRALRAQPRKGQTRASWTMHLEQSLTATYEQEAGDPRLEHQLTVEVDPFGQVVRNADIAYARRSGRLLDVPSQGESSLLVHDHRLLNVDTPERFEIGIPLQGRDYEVVGAFSPDGSLIARTRLVSPEVVAALDSPGPYHEVPSGTGARLLSWERSLYWNAARTEALPFGEVGPVTLVHHEEAACFAPEFVRELFAERVDPTRLTLLGYELHDGCYWKRDDVHHFDGPERFWQKTALEARGGGRTTFTYDAHALEVVAVQDALGNTTRAEIDYHLLEAWRIADPNGAVAEVRYDPLGVIIAQSSYGQVSGNPWGFDALTAVEGRIPASMAELLGAPERYLQGASGYTWYDLDAWRNGRAPIPAVTLSRETLPRDGQGGGTADGRIQVQVTFLDGLGRTLQSRTRVEAGLAIQRGEDGRVLVDVGGQPVEAPTDTRWQVSGHVVYDLKQRPGLVYEPFFSPTWQFEGDEVLQRFGVATQTLYDAVGRVVSTYLPNGTLTRTTYQAWSVTQADANDTILDAALYRAQREHLSHDHPERQALEHALAHAGTTTSTFLDAQGRQVGSLTRGGRSTEDRRSEVRLDVEGQAYELIDARGLTAFRYCRDMEGRVLFTHSMDAGDSWILPDADDRAVFSWDGGGYEVEVEYDVLDRVISKHVRGNGLDHRVEERVYGESLPDASSRNLLGQVVTVRDQAGENTVELCDPAGQVLRTSQRLRADLDEPDWRSTERLEEEDRFVSEVSYDALGRPVRVTQPDQSVRSMEYSRSGGLFRLRLTTPDGRLTDLPIVDGMAFDAHGQRTLARLGNGLEVAYRYDPLTRRLITQIAQRGVRRFQDLQYTYDPVGNLVRIEDRVHEPGRMDAIISGVTQSARRDYVYDAHYRLVQATGRVHQALLEHDYIPGIPSLKGTRHLSLNNRAAIERFTRTYQYDPANNLRRIQHSSPSQTWVTEMWLSPSSNRSMPLLDSGGLPVSNPESRFSPTGHQMWMPHLRRIDWSWRGTLSGAVVIERDGAPDEERYTYGSDGMRVRKVTTERVHGQLQVTEKVYLGSCERKRITLGDTLILERWTSHVSDGQSRVALVHRWVIDTLGRETDSPGQVRIHYQLTTHQGSSALEIDQEGNLLSYEEYFPYGGSAFVAGDNVREIKYKDYRYVGKERDDATSFYYYGYRYYAPWVGRWLSPDPIGPEDDLNLYQFVLGDPVGNVDEEGLQTTSNRRILVQNTVGNPVPLIQPSFTQYSYRTGVSLNSVETPAGTIHIPHSVTETIDRGEIQITSFGNRTAFVSLYPCSHTNECRPAWEGVVLSSASDLPDPTTAERTSHPHHPRHSSRHHRRQDHSHPPAGTPDAAQLPQEHAGQVEPLPSADLPTASSSANEEHARSHPGQPAPLRQSGSLINNAPEARLAAPSRGIPDADPPSVTDSPTAQFVAGLGIGGAAGWVPIAGPLILEYRMEVSRSHNTPPPPALESGIGLGQAAMGLAQMISGLFMMGGGGTGGAAAVLAAPESAGVSLLALPGASAAFVSGFATAHTGAMNIWRGVTTFMNARNRPGGGPTGGSQSPPSESESSGRPSRGHRRTPPRPGSSQGNPPTPPTPRRPPPNRMLSPEEVGLRPEDVNFQVQQVIIGDTAHVIFRYIRNLSHHLGGDIETATTLRTTSQLRRLWPRLHEIAAAEGAHTLRIRTTQIVEPTGRLRLMLENIGFRRLADGSMSWEGPVNPAAAREAFIRALRQIRAFRGSVPAR